MIELLKTFLSLVQLSSQIIPQAPYSRLPLSYQRAGLWEQERVKNRLLGEMESWKGASMKTTPATLMRPLKLKSEIAAEEQKEGEADGDGDEEGENVQISTSKIKRRKAEELFLALEPLKLNAITDAQLLRAAKNGHSYQILHIIKRRKEMGVERIPPELIRILREDERFRCIRNWYLKM
jgi:hypothetical protein